MFCEHVKHIHEHLDDLTPWISYRAATCSVKTYRVRSSITRVCTATAIGGIALQMEASSAPVAALAQRRTERVGEQPPVGGQGERDGQRLLNGL